MGNIVVLAGPQGIGKTRKAGQLCEALGCSMIADNWDGKTDHGISVLYITNAPTFIHPAGARVIRVSNEAEIDALIATSEVAAPSAPPVAFDSRPSGLFRR